VNFFSSETKKKEKKKYKQEIKESSKINKRRLVKVTPPLEGGDVYTELRGESQFTALEC